MGRKCNLELCLSLASSVDDDGDGDRQPQLLSGPSSNQHQRLALLHDGQISVCDVTELQAKAIICRASQCETSRKNADECVNGYETRTLQISIQRTLWGLSMKRSLQRFLHKRNKRIQSASPYYRR